MALWYKVEFSFLVFGFSFRRAVQHLGIHSKVAGSTITVDSKKKNIFLFINHHDGYFFDDWVSVVATSSSAAMHRSSEWLLFQR